MTTNVKSCCVCAHERARQVCRECRDYSHFELMSGVRVNTPRNMFPNIGDEFTYRLNTWRVVKLNQRKQPTPYKCELVRYSDEGLRVEQENYARLSRSFSSFAEYMKHQQQNGHVVYLDFREIYRLKQLTKEQSP